jgi:hypothetical protein
MAMSNTVTLQQGDLVPTKNTLKKMNKRERHMAKLEERRPTTVDVEFTGDITKVDTRMFARPKFLSILVGGHDGDRTSNTP